MNPVILHINDSGDQSVGIFSQSWQIPCPFSPDEDQDIQDIFKKDIADIYAPFCDGRMTALFDYEYKQIEEQCFPDYAPTPVPDTPEPVVDGSKELILEVGKKYVTRDGQVGYCESKTGGGLKWPFDVRFPGEDFRCYTQNGIWLTAEEPTPFDIVAEYTEKVPHNEYLPHTEPINT